MEAGLPPGGLNVLPCDNRVAERFVIDPRFKLLSFTGSAAVGWMLKAKSGKKKVVLELGGNAGVIVEPDADLDFAAQRCAAGGFGYAGQILYFRSTNLCPSFTLPISSHEAPACKSARLKAGDPSDDATVVGPLIDQKAAHRVEMDRGSGGARRACAARWQTHGLGHGGHRVVQRHPDDESFLSGGVWAGGDGHALSPLRRGDRGAEPLDYGLQAGVFTQDVNKVFHAFRPS